MHSRNLRFLHDQQRAVLLCAALPPPLEYRLTMNEVFDERGRPQLERLRAHLASEGLLTEEAALRIVHEGAALLRSEPTVLEVEAPITGVQFVFAHSVLLQACLRASTPSSPAPSLARRRPMGAGERRCPRHVRRARPICSQSALLVLPQILFAFSFSFVSLSLSLSPAPRAHLRSAY